MDLHNGVRAERNTKNPTTRTHTSFIVSCKHTDTQNHFICQFPGLSGLASDPPRMYKKTFKRLLERYSNRPDSHSEAQPTVSEMSKNGNTAFSIQLKLCAMNFIPGKPLPRSGGSTWWQRPSVCLFVFVCSFVSNTL